MAAVLGVAAVVCCACAIAGDMLQDLKVGHLLGGTPKAMEKAELIGVVAAALLMTFPMMILHKADIIRSKSEQNQKPERPGSIPR